MSKSKQQGTSNDNRAKEGMKNDKSKDMPKDMPKDTPKPTKGDHKDKADMNTKPEINPKQDKHTRNKSDDKKTSKAK
ncbi:hypothetical protein GGI09_003845 [Coemansia sp. S100]|nr:hypothetical protein LPJ71_001156 [Coemansia sp. S17]KAJ2097412.1 hypothetical protein GGI09_003845 [Coemansia sp. S100]